MRLLPLHRVLSRLAPVCLLVTLVSQALAQAASTKPLAQSLSLTAARTISARSHNLRSRAQSARSMPLAQCRSLKVRSLKVRARTWRVRSCGAGRSCGRSFGRVRGVLECSVFTALFFARERSNLNSAQSLSLRAPSPAPSPNCVLDMAHMVYFCDNILCQINTLFSLTLLRPNCERRSTRSRCRTRP